MTYHENEREERYLALNECTIKSIEGSLVADVEIKGQLFETFRGDGLCLSTPSGSTAYNKALGGAIIHPSIRAIQLAEMASINNRVFRTVGSPLLLPSHHDCMIKPRNEVDFQVTIDHLTLLHKDVKSIRCQVASEKCGLRDSVRFHFGNYDTIVMRDKLLDFIEVLRRESDLIFIINWRYSTQR